VADVSPIDLGGPAETLTYQLSQGERLTPQAIAMSVDGSGAASAFVVQCTMQDQSGRVLSRTRTDDSFAVGDTGEATFAPF